MGFLNAEGPNGRGNARAAITIALYAFSVSGFSPRLPCKVAEQELDENGDYQQLAATEDNYYDNYLGEKARVECERQAKPCPWDAHLAASVCSVPDSDGKKNVSFPNRSAYACTFDPWPLWKNLSYVVNATELFGNQTVGTGKN